ncbi:unnamed protein product [Prorocentrum cordatum]|uniref:PH domain-containing protein n=1 Tax=Prorocentrum cordatum TaxID=2364126 RepID=A0ABN9TPF4_9DINO|nr:unnamed protein product [Polarella glacialis]
MAARSQTAADNEQASQWLALMRSLQAQGHEVQQTVGFAIRGGQLSVEQAGARRKAAASRHKSAGITFGAMVAQRCAAEEQRPALGQATVGAALRLGGSIARKPAHGRRLLQMGRAPLRLRDGGAASAASPSA